MWEDKPAGFLSHFCSLSGVLRSQSSYPAKQAKNRKAKENNKSLQPEDDSRFGRMNSLASSICGSGGP